MNLVLVVACLQAVTIMYKITPPPLPPKSGRPLYKPPKPAKNFLREKTAMSCWASSDHISSCIIS